MQNQTLATPVGSGCPMGTVFLRTLRDKPPAQNNVIQNTICQKDTFCTYVSFDIFLEKVT